MIIKIKSDALKTKKSTFPSTAQHVLGISKKYIPNFIKFHL